MVRISFVLAVSAAGAADFAEEDAAISMLQTHDQDLVCVHANKGDIAPSEGLFNGLQVDIGDVAQVSGRFCVKKDVHALVQRSFALSKDAQSTEKSVSGKNAGNQKKATTPLLQTFSCDHECIKTEAKLQGADIITSVDNLKYAMEVVFQDVNSDSGDACGKTNLTFPPYRVAANPSLGTKITTAEGRMEPSIVFECDPDKIYHLLMADALAGAFQNNQSYNHWLKLNLVCEQNGQAKVQDNGRIVAQEPGIFPIPPGYVPPAFPFNVLHHFGFYIYETAAPFTDSELDQIDKDFPAMQAIELPSHPLVEQVAAFLKFTSPPVAWNWIDVTTSYWSMVRMGRLAAVVPAIKDTSFFQLICPCNLASSFPGIFVNGRNDCNL